MKRPLFGLATALAVLILAGLLTPRLTDALSTRPIPPLLAGSVPLRDPWARPAPEPTIAGPRVGLPRGSSAPECSLGLSRSSLYRPPLSIPERLSAQLPRSLPEEFGLLRALSGDPLHSNDRSVVSLVWTDRSCRRIRLSGPGPGHIHREQARVGRWALIEDFECRIVVQVERCMEYARVTARGRTARLSLEGFGRADAEEILTRYF